MLFAAPKSEVIPLAIEKLVSESSFLFRPIHVGFFIQKNDDLSPLSCHAGHPLPTPSYVNGIPRGNPDSKFDTPTSATSHSAPLNSFFHVAFDR